MPSVPKQRFLRTVLAWCVLAVALLPFTVFSPAAHAFSWPWQQNPLAATSTVDSPAEEDILMLSQLADVESPAADLAQIKQLLADMLKTANNHDLQGVLAHYSPRFISGDGMSLPQLKTLISDTWESFPTIGYKSSLLDIRLNANWAAVESLDEAQAVIDDAPPSSAVMSAGLEKPVKKPTSSRFSALWPWVKKHAQQAASISNTDKSKTRGLMSSTSRGILYLHKTGKTWEVVGDQTLLETALIAYGAAKGVGFRLSCPEQVLAGSSYTAQLSASLPEGLIGIASISKDPIVYPQPKPQERFRTITAEDEPLERVFVANNNHYNELLTATVGLAQLGSLSFDSLEKSAVTLQPENNPVLNMVGVATLIRRVNIQTQGSASRASATDNTP